VIRFVLRRVAYGALVLLGVNLLTFVLFFTINTPDDMARLNLGGKRISAEAIEKWKAERGYDKPLYVNTAEQGTARYTETIFWEAPSRCSRWSSAAPTAKAPVTSAPRSCSAWG